MSLIVALPKRLFALICALLFPKQRIAFEPPQTTYRRLPARPDNFTVYRWTRYLIRRFPAIDWQFQCKGEWVYICFTAPAPGYLRGLQSKLGGGTITNAGLVYAIALS